MPAMCGDAMDVPEIRSKLRPKWNGGATEARMSTPGAAMSGFRKSPSVVTEGPRDENVATSGTCGAAASSAAVSGTILAVAAAPVSRGFSSRRMSDRVSSSCASPSSAKYSVWTGTMTLSAATRALTVSGPSDGGQSNSVNR